MTRNLFTVALLFAGSMLAAEHPERPNFEFQSVCPGLPSQTALQAALVAARSQANGGFNLDMWGTIVNRDGVVCAVAFTGATRSDQWPGSRAISAQKANTANAFSLPKLALSTANLYSAVQPGGSLYGLQHSNPVDTDVAYGGDATNYGQVNDPMVGGKIGGGERVRGRTGALAIRNTSSSVLSASAAILPARTTTLRGGLATISRSILCRAGRQWRQHTSGQHRVRHHRADGLRRGCECPAMGTSRVQRNGNLDCRHVAQDSLTR